MKLISRVRALAVLGALALVAASPAVASSGSSTHGNKCGKGHAKHTKKVGATCVKHNAAKAHRAALVRQAKRDNESLATEQDEQTTDAADDDATENDQGEDANDQGDDVNENDQGDDVDGNDQGDDVDD
jgi:hypothetical protein